MEQRHDSSLVRWRISHVHNIIFFWFLRITYKSCPHLRYCDFPSYNYKDHIRSPIPSSTIGSLVESFPLHSTSAAFKRWSYLSFPPSTFNADSPMTLFSSSRKSRPSTADSVDTGTNNQWNAGTTTATTTTTSTNAVETGDGVGFSSGSAREDRTQSQHQDKSSSQSYTTRSKKYKYTDHENYYDILQIYPNATKADIKRAYFALARQTHPDAVFQQSLQRPTVDDKTKKETTRTNIDFHKVSQAYRTLYDPLERKRYDRSLAAAAFTSDFEDMLGKWTASAGPPVQRVIDQFAMPFLRRSAATAAATLATAAEELLATTSSPSSQRKRDRSKKDFSVATSSTSSMEMTSNSNAPVSSNSNGNLTMVRENPISPLERFVVKAIRAGQRASRVIDQIELREKRKELQLRAEEEWNTVLKLREEIAHIASQRLSLTLQTPFSQLSSVDAYKIFATFLVEKNESSTRSFLDSMLHKRTIADHIGLLEQVEREYEDKLDTKNQLLRNLDEKTRQAQQAQLNVDMAIQAEERARKALDDAIQLVTSTKAKKLHCAKALSSSEEAYKRIINDVDKLELTLQRRQERVRQQLLRKQEYLIHKKETSTQQDTTSGSSIDSTPQHASMPEDLVDTNLDDEIILLEPSNNYTYNMKVIEELRQKENFLLLESTRLENKVARMDSRVQKLLSRSDED